MNWLRARWRRLIGDPADYLNGRTPALRQLLDGAAPRPGLVRRLFSLVAIKLH